MTLLRIQVSREARYNYSAVRFTASVLWIPCLARLLAPQHAAFEFALGLEPIVQLSARFFAAFKIDFVCATSDFLVTRRVPYRNLPRRRLGGGCFGLCASISLWFRCHTLLLLPYVGRHMWAAMISPVMPQAVRFERLRPL